MKKERIVINEFEGVSNNSFELRCAIYPNVTNGKYEANDNSDLTAKQVNNNEIIKANSAEYVYLGSLP